MDCSFTCAPEQTLGLPGECVKQRRHLAYPLLSFLSNLSLESQGRWRGNCTKYYLKMDMLSLIFQCFYFGNSSCIHTFSTLYGRRLNFLDPPSSVVAAHCKVVDLREITCFMSFSEKTLCHNKRPSCPSSIPHSSNVHGIFVHSSIKLFCPKRLWYLS